MNLASRSRLLLEIPPYFYDPLQQLEQKGLFLNPSYFPHPVVSANVRQRLGVNWERSLIVLEKKGGFGRDKYSYRRREKEEIYS